MEETVEETQAVEETPRDAKVLRGAMAVPGTYREIQPIGNCGKPTRDPQKPEVAAGGRLVIVTLESEEW